MDKAQLINKIREIKAKKVKSKTDESLIKALEYRLKQIESNETVKK